MSSIRNAARLLIPIFLAVLAACGDAEERVLLAPTGRAGFVRVPGGALLQCPTSQAAYATATIDELGGELRAMDGAGGVHTVTFPPGAVGEPTVFTLTAPASDYVLVEMDAYDEVTGEVKTVTFPADAYPTVSISYERCPAGFEPGRTLQLFQLDPATHALVASPFGGEVPPSDPSVVGVVGGMSEYAVGSPEDRLSDPWAFQ